MYWLRRLPYTKSLWRSLNIEEVGNIIFDPTEYSLDKLEMAKRRITNLVWAEVYNSLKNVDPMSSIYVQMNTLVFLCV